MKVEKIELTNFRNIEKMTLQADPDVTIIFGQNAQGKTNILEALWLFTGTRSFRGAKDAELVKTGQKGFQITLDSVYDGMEQHQQLRFFEKKKATRNGVVLESPGLLNERFKAVIFAPGHLAMLEDGPAARRKFVDGAITQLRPGVVRLLQEYQRAVIQRNTVLRDMARNSGLEPMLDAFEEQIAAAGAKIMNFRARYIEQLKAKAFLFYTGISAGKEELAVAYRPSVEHRPELKDTYLTLKQALRQGRKEDILSGVTGRGPHRDELAVNIGALPAREFASQGQKRSAVLALKLAEAELLHQSFNQSPVILLDDVLSELDSARQDYILNHLKGWQVFITCCDPEQAHRQTRGTCFEIEQGRIK